MVRCTETPIERAVAGIRSDLAMIGMLRSR